MTLKELNREARKGVVSEESVRSEIARLLYADMMREKIRIRELPENKGRPFS